MTQTPPQPDLSRLRDELASLHGQASPEWDSLMRLAPVFVAAYLKFAGVPRRRNHLDDKTRAFIALAADACATQLYAPGVARHIERALSFGATRDELVEVLELISTIGIHTSNVGVPVLLEVLEEEGLRDGPAPLDERRQALKAAFEKNRGYWHPSWEGLLELDPDLFDAYVEFSSVPWRSGVLSPKLKEFMYCAFDASATHLYVPGLKLHMRNALHYGATAEELMELLEIVSVTGIHGAELGAPLLEAALANAAGAPEKPHA
ncbi:gamma-carboxymuconolactone decarboxylase [Paraburkholderia sp. Ac-20336]|uniref:carboxymuconolactone decarboxylase family protein n=1 Tax=Burkholderiaceae TaxID=119060 RepID=UPI0014218F1C|nr:MULTISPECIES: carboxymuconolactone decarboxylase family protein [Burkholderiaceae]MBN3801482.1 gamma-carboxymuconolactone decarboxylase [Paraburkholderia sp. Ac-20336]MBN3846033.1 gamma-carboxymuconolactone decarboxylase [Paraburkholderia sp. Ac-20342]NIF54175.1 gamma-carboxymuconolactone decarboxylase [Burkholderia sp. Ax-1724]NIF77715.1 gamma-carboxymuconolactone decarboxylase [Paraburkholderia sp. Cy-641]